MIGCFRYNMIGYFRSKNEKKMESIDRCKYDFNVMDGCFHKKQQQRKKKKNKSFYEYVTNFKHLKWKIFGP